MWVVHSWSICKNRILQSGDRGELAVHWFWISNCYKTQSFARNPIQFCNI